MDTTVYFIRHSVRFKNTELIESYKTDQSELLKNEKIILSNEEELQNMDVVYTSNCVRTLQTAKYLLDKQKLKVNIDDRFDERRVGVPNEDKVSDWYTQQYLDENYKTVGGESQLEVRDRMYEALMEVVNANKGKRIAVFSHGYAITFLLLKWCKLESISTERILKINFRGKNIFNKRLNSPEVFKLVFDSNNEIKSIENIEFDDLEFDDFNK